MFPVGLIRMTLSASPSSAIPRSADNAGTVLAMVSMLVDALFKLIFYPFGEHPMGITSPPKADNILGAIL